MQRVITNILSAGKKKEEKSYVQIMLVKTSYVQKVIREKEKKDSYVQQKTLYSMSIRRVGLVLQVSSCTDPQRYLREGPWVRGWMVRVRYKRGVRQLTGGPWGRAGAKLGERRQCGGRGPRLRGPREKRGT